MEKGDQDHLNYHQPSGIPADWRFGNPQQPLAMMPANPMAAGSSPCPSVSVVDSYCATLWDHPPPNSSQGLGFPHATNAAPLVRPPPLDSSSLEMAAAAEMYLHSGAGGGILTPPGLPQFSADSAFIERAARFSCLGGTNFVGALMSPFGGMTQHLDGYAPGLTMMLGAHHHPQNDAPSMGESSKGMSVDHGSPNAGSPMSSHKDAGAHSTAVAGEDSSEAELNGNGNGICLGDNPNSAENVPVDPSLKGFAGKKRRKNDQEMEIDQTKGEGETSNEKAQGNKGIEENKPDGKNIGKTAADPPKEEYVHVRARRGQATNSHSLAERVRREKISERMKFLQDLVPGCSKVTGKAVMLDEIINYVQSLQRQVELLSMKLAAVNPQFDYNIEGLLSKDMLQQRPGPSSAIGFPPEMPHPLLHQPQGFIHPGISAMGTDAFRRVMSAQMTTISTFKDAKQQVPNAWENEFQNVFQMGYGNSPPNDIQNLNGSLPHTTNDS